MPLIPNALLLEREARGFLRVRLVQATMSQERSELLKWEMIGNYSNSFLPFSCLL